jgi:predicted RND superfamily exporter protein
VYRLTRLSLTYPKLTLLAVALVTAVLGVGLTRLRTEFGYRVLVGDDHPSIRTLDSFIEQFGGGMPFYIVWECGEGHPCNTAFDRTSLAMADSVAQALSPLPAVQRVEGLANAGLLVPSQGGFAVRHFVEDGELVADAAYLAVRAIEDPLWLGNLVSADGTVGSIIVQTIDNQAETHLGVFEAVEEALAPFEAQGFEFHLVGEAPITVIGGRDLAESSAKLIPIMVLVIAVILLMLSRSWRDAAIALPTMGLGLLWTLGLLGWLGWPKDGILEVLAPLILVVGVCDAIHLLARYSAEMNAVAERPELRQRTQVLLRVVRDTGAPCLITTLTTAAAFLSFAASALDAFCRFGVISAFGVSACLILTFTLLPILARLFLVPGAGADRTSALWRLGLDAVVRTAERRAIPIVVMACVLLVVCGAGWIGRLRVDNRWLESFGEYNRGVKSVRFVEERLRPAESLEIEIALPPHAPLDDPQTLRTLDEFSQTVSSADGRGSATSILDLVKRMNRLLHDDHPAFERLGETRAANAEMLELIALDGPELLGSWVSLDRSRLRISVETTEQSYSRHKAGMEAVRRYAKAALPEDWTVRFSGDYAIGVEWVRDIQETQLRSFPTALVLVLVMVALFLRSFRLALAAMVPTLLPVVMTLGTMGWIGMSLDVGRAMIAAVLIGIGVDDSIHLLHQYARRRAAGDGPPEAIRGAVRHVGRAVVTTSLALSLGFLTLMASAWQTIADFGLLVSIAILGALVATLFVLPALVFAAERAQGRREFAKEWPRRAGAEEHRRRSACTG